MSGFSRERYPDIRFRGIRFFVFAIVMSALLSVTVAPLVHAQNTDPWTGYVQVDVDDDGIHDANANDRRIEIPQGESVYYSVRLSEAPVQRYEGTDPIRLQWTW